MANRIKEIRKQKGLTQGELGKKIGVNTSTISHWEAGTRKIKIEYGMAICEVLGCTLNDIFMPSNLPKRKKQVG